MLMMDGWTGIAAKRKRVVFVTKAQADHYGGYAYVASALEADIILPPSMIEEFHADLGEFHEVGHA